MRLTKRKTKPKVGIYCRVSTTDKQTTKSQRHSLREWAISAHIPESELTWYEDKQSGKTIDRPSLNRLLRHVAQGKVDTVVVYDLSRLAHNLIDGLKTLADLAHKVRVVSVSENIDFSNSTGMLIASILLSVAQWSREQTVERIRQGLAARKADGKTLGRPRDAKRLTKVRKLYDSGLGVTSIAERLRCSRQNVYALLERGKESAA